MKKTVNVNLGGFSFVMDENAYEKMKQYLDDLQRYYSKNDEQEVVSDIEDRISELLRAERDRQYKEVFSENDVQKVIDLMGKPDDFETVGGDKRAFDNVEFSAPSHGRKLFRDSGNAQLAGVAAGLAAYFDVDTIWVRLAWVVLFFAMNVFALTAYLICWLIMPKTNNAVDWLEMHGQDVTNENLGIAKQQFEAAQSNGNDNKWLFCLLALIVVFPFVFVLLLFLIVFGGLGLLGGVFMSFWPIALLILCPIAAMATLFVQLIRKKKGSKFLYGAVYLILLALWILALVKVCTVDFISQSTSGFSSKSFEVDDSGIRILSESGDEEFVIDDNGIRFENNKDTITENVDSTEHGFWVE